MPHRGSHRGRTLRRKPNVKARKQQSPKRNCNSKHSQHAQANASKSDDDEQSNIIGATAALQASANTPLRVMPNHLFRAWSNQHDVLDAIHAINPGIDGNISCPQSNCGRIHYELVTRSGGNSSTHTAPSHMLVHCHFASLRLTDAHLTVLAATVRVSLLDVFARLQQQRPQPCCSLTAAGAHRCLLIRMFLSDNQIEGHGLLPMLNLLCAPAMFVQHLCLQRNPIDDSRAAPIIAHYLRRCHFVPHCVDVSGTKLSERGVLQIVQAMIARKNACEEAEDGDGDEAMEMAMVHQVVALHETLQSMRVPLQQNTEACVGIEEEFRRALYVPMALIVNKEVDVERMSEMVSDAILVCTGCDYSYIGHGVCTYDHCAVAATMVTEDNANHSKEEELSVDVLALPLVHLFVDAAEYKETRANSKAIAVTATVEAETVVTTMTTTTTTKAKKAKKSKEKSPQKKSVSKDKDKDKDDKKQDDVHADTKLELNGGKTRAHTRTPKQSLAVHSDMKTDEAVKATLASQTATPPTNVAMENKSNAETVVVSREQPIATTTTITPVKKKKKTKKAKDTPSQKKSASKETDKNDKLNEAHGDTKQSLTADSGMKTDDAIVRVTTTAVPPSVAIENKPEAETSVATKTTTPAKKKKKKKTKSASKDKDKDNKLDEVHQDTKQSLTANSDVKTGDAIVRGVTTAAGKASPSHTATPPTNVAIENKSKAETVVVSREQPIATTTTTTTTTPVTKKKKKKKKKTTETDKNDKLYEVHEGMKQSLTANSDMKTDDAIVRGVTTAAVKATPPSGVIENKSEAETVVATKTTTTPVKKKKKKKAKDTPSQKKDDKQDEAHDDDAKLTLNKNVATTKQQQSLAANSGMQTGDDIVRVTTAAVKVTPASDTKKPAIDTEKATTKRANKSPQQKWIFGESDDEEDQVLEDSKSEEPPIENCKQQNGALASAASVASAGASETSKNVCLALDEAALQYMLTTAWKPQLNGVHAPKPPPQLVTAFYEFMYYAKKKVPQSYEKWLEVLKVLFDATNLHTNQVNLHAVAHALVEKTKIMKQILQSRVHCDRLIYQMQIKRFLAQNKNIPFSLSKWQSSMPEIVHCENNPKLIDKLSKWAAQLKQSNWNIHREWLSIVGSKYIKFLMESNSTAGKTKQKQSSVLYGIMVRYSLAAETMRCMKFVVAEDTIKACREQNRKILDRCVKKNIIHVVPDFNQLNDQQMLLVSVEKSTNKHENTINAGDLHRQLYASRNNDNWQPSFFDEGI